MAGEATPRTGRCHCGAVTFTAVLPEDLKGSRCNCSICSRKGAVTVYLPADALTITAGEDALGCYRFNTGVARHYFCATCGIHCFHRTRADPNFYGVNAACLDGVSPYDFAEVPVMDGVNHPRDTNGVRRQVGTLRFERAVE